MMPEINKYKQLIARTGKFTIGDVQLEMLSKTLKWNHALDNWVNLSRSEESGLGLIRRAPY